MLNTRKNSVIKVTSFYPMLCAMSFSVEPVKIALIANHINNVGTGTSSVCAGLCKGMVTIGTSQ